MAFRKKADYILTEKPDILVIPECECPEKLIFEKDTPKPTDIYWYGDNYHKGLGIFSYSDFKITPFSDHNVDFRYVLPLTIENKKEKIYLIAVWAQKPNGHDNYGLQIWNAINYYTDLLKHDKVIIAGDFNSSSIWDKPNREANHSNIVKFLNDTNFESAYHFFHKQEQGIKKLKEVRVGKYEDWTKYSDHKPMIVTFEK